MVDDTPPRVATAPFDIATKALPRRYISNGCPGKVVCPSRVSRPRIETSTG